MNIRQAMKLVSKGYAEHFKRKLWGKDFAKIGAANIILWADDDLKDSQITLTMYSFLATDWMVEIDGMWIDDYQKAKRVIQ